MIGLIGAGGHAKVVAEIFQSEADPETLMLFSADWRNPPSFFRSFPHAADDESQFQLWRERIRGWHVAIGNTTVRKQKIMQLQKIGCELFSAVHKKSWISPSARIGRGTAVMGGAVINADSSVGTGCIVNTSASIDHDCRIGPFTNIGPGCRLAGGAEIGEGSDMGSGSIVIPRVKVGKHCVVGAGSVVIRDLPDHCKSRRSAARIIGRHE